MKIKAIILDIDGVLLDSTKQLIKFHKMVAKLLGLRIPEDREFSVLWGRPIEDFLKTLWPDADINEYRRVAREIFDKEVIKFPPIKGAKITLDKLKELGLKLGIVTGRRKKYTIKHMKEAGFDLNMFDVVISSEDTKKHKPRPEPILHACKLLKIKPEEAVYVGDSLLDYQSAKRANVKFIAVLSGDFDEKEFRESGVENIISSVVDLPEFLRLMKS